MVRLILSVSRNLAGDLPGRSSEFFWIFRDPSSSAFWHLSHLPRWGFFRRPAYCIAQLDQSCPLQNNPFYQPERFSPREGRNRLYPILITPTVANPDTSQLYLHLTNLISTLFLSCIEFMTATDPSTSHATPSLIWSQ
jgi:hypothetical protein